MEGGGEQLLIILVTTVADSDDVLVQLIRIPAPRGEALEAVDEGRPHPLYDTLTKELPAYVTEHHHDLPRPPSDGRGRVRETGEERRPNVVDFWEESVLQQERKLTLH